MTALRVPQKSLTRTLVCDSVYGCPMTFVGADWITTPNVRMAARRLGWHCRNPAPNRPAFDLCPDHAEEMP